MSDLLWPGDHRADTVFSDAAVLAAMVRVEEVWLAALVDHDVAPAAAAVRAGGLAGLLGPGDVEEVAVRADRDGNPVVGLVTLLRERLGSAGELEAARWLHRGLTSQDVLDTALVLATREVVREVRRALVAQVDLMVALVRDHRDSVMTGRTLTQHAVPTTFGLKAAGWLGEVLDVDEDLAGLRFAVQVGGAAGTLAGPVELAGSAPRARGLATTLADQLGLVDTAPWHTRRRGVTRAGDALVAACDAWGHVANDVLVLGRPEIGEVTESAGGGSSTMPGKANPVRSLLLRSAALAAPGHGAALHLAAAGQVDERADGAWQAEWTPLRTLARHAVAAASLATELLAGLEVHAQVMRDRARSAATALVAERGSMADLAGRVEPGADPADYLGVAGDLVDEALARAATHPRPRETP